jgi:hypothetical protein
LKKKLLSLANAETLVHFRMLLSVLQFVDILVVQGVSQYFGHFVSC